MVKTKNKTKLINFKVSPEEYEAIKAKAERYEDGNLSLWLRKQGKSDPSILNKEYQIIEVPEDQWPLIEEVAGKVVYASHKNT